MKIKEYKIPLWLKGLYSEELVYLHRPDRKEAIPLLNTFQKEMPYFCVCFFQLGRYLHVYHHTKNFLIRQDIIINMYLLTVIFLPLIPKQKNLHSF